MGKSEQEACIDAHDILSNIPTFSTSRCHSNSSAATTVHFKHVKLSHSAFSDVNPEAHSHPLFMHFSELYNLLISALVRNDSSTQHSRPASEKGVGYIKINRRPARVQCAAPQVCISSALSIFSGTLSKKKWKLDISKLSQSVGERQETLCPMSSDKNLFF